MLFSRRVWQVFAKLWTRPRRSSVAQRSILIHGMNYAPEIIGVGKYTTELAQFLAAQGHAVSVVAALPHYPSWKVDVRPRWRFATQQDDGVRVTRCPLLVRPGGRIWRLVAPLSFAVLAAPLVLWRALRDRPQTVLCVEPTLFAAPAALLAAHLVDARTVLHVQDLELDAAVATGYLGRIAPLVTFGRVFERAMRRRFDAVVTISDAMAARLRQQVAPGSVHVLRNWLDPRALRPRRSVDAMRRNLGIPPECRLILYAGNLGAKQGVPILVEAARHLRADPSIRILVVGDGVMAAPLRAAAAALPNLDYHGLLPFEDLGSLLAAADLHVLPQEKAASDLVFPSKLGPLLTSDRPIVVTAEPRSELALWLGGAARRCRPGDGRALAATLVEALGYSCNTNPERAGALLASLHAVTILTAFERCLLVPERVPAGARVEEATVVPTAQPLPVALA